MSRRRRSLLDNKPRLAGVTPTPAPDKEGFPPDPSDVEDDAPQAAELPSYGAPLQPAEPDPPLMTGEEDPTQHYWQDSSEAPEEAYYADEHEGSAEVSLTYEDDAEADGGAYAAHDDGYGGAPDAPYDDPAPEETPSTTAAWISAAGRRAATPTPPPAAAPPPRPQSAWLDLPSMPPRVSERDYSDHGAPPQDVEAHGWDRSVHSPLEERFKPVANELPPPPDDLFDFGGWDGKGIDPPTEDVPAAVMEDLAQGYSAPMNVPEPPPVPGIVDRYTPPPVPRSQAPVRPDKPAFAPTPAPPLRKAAPVVDDDDDDSIQPPPAGPPRILVFGAVFFLGGLVLFGLAVILLVVGLNRPPAEPELPPSRLGGPTAPTPGPGGLPTRTTLHDAPVPAPDADTDVDSDTVPEVAPAPAPAPAPAAAPAPAPAPPRPKPKPVEDPVAKTGTMRIRANRKVLIYVDGRPEDYAPLDLKLEPGSYKVSAALPGRPETEKVVSVELGAGKIERVEFTF